MNRHSIWKSGYKKTILPLTEEREFEKNLKNIETLEENSRKLYKSTKMYMDTNIAVGKAARKMSQEFAASAVCERDENLKADVERWDEASAKLEQSLVDLNNSCQKVMVEPLKKLNGVFPAVQAVVKKREQSLVEYTKCQQKAEKYQDRDRTGANIVKAETSKKTLNAAKEDFNSHNFALSEDIQTLYMDRVSYIEPCIQALIQAQVSQASESFKVLTELSILTDCKDDYSSSIQRKLTATRALSITIDD